MPLFVANVNGTLLAYRNSCPDCGGRGGRRRARGRSAGLPGCGRGFSLPQAGRSLDGDGLQLQPIPLLREQEEIKVAL